MTGEIARGMGHGICVYNEDTKLHSDILFIETDESKLSAIGNCRQREKLTSEEAIKSKPIGEPLTLEQLREMNETPIYVVTEAYGSGWCILNWHGVNKSYTYFSRTGTSEGMTATPLSAKTYGDLWTAYRRPPGGEANG